jgi:hypothetical protein
MHNAAFHLPVLVQECHNLFLGFCSCHILRRNALLHCAGFELVLCTQMPSTYTSTISSATELSAQDFGGFNHSSRTISDLSSTCTWLLAPPSFMCGDAPIEFFWGIGFCFSSFFVLSLIGVFFASSVLFFFPPSLSPFKPN